ncbi:MAG: hypothetical protein H6Q55_4091, partial [Deltaproteobacteria bacterium]|nr:hypothetical protein [Deltaproteobacteria bacterium]
ELVIRNSEPFDTAAELPAYGVLTHLVEEKKS